MYKLSMTSAVVVQDFLNELKRLTEEGYEVVAAYGVLEKPASIIRNSDGSESQPVIRHFAILRKFMGDAN